MKKFQKSIFAAFILLFLTLMTAYSQDIYWEEARLFVPAKARFYEVKTMDSFVVVMWQEFVSARGSEGGEIYLSFAYSRDGVSWDRKERVMGPFPYVDKETKIFSITIDPLERIFVALSYSEKVTRIFMSDDYGENFSWLDVSAPVTIVHPLIYSTFDNKLLLFVIYESEDVLSIYYVSIDVETFSDRELSRVLKPFVENSEVGLNFLPSHTALNNRDYVVFQALLAGKDVGYQLFIKSSDDRGKTWSTARMITGFPEFDGNRELTFDTFLNQRPFITVLDNQLTVIWERTPETGSQEVYLLSLDEEGEYVSHERVTNDDFNNLAPRVIHYNKTPYITWFDNRRGDDRVFMAVKRDLSWEESDLSFNAAGNSGFPEPVVLGENLFVFWENLNKNTGRIFLLAPDQSVAKPVITPLNFRAGGKSRLSNMNIRWRAPADVSGILGYRYTWGRVKAYNQALEKEILKNFTSTSVRADEDGVWYFFIKAGDYAGNWSEPARISYIRDTEPPEPVIFDEIETDETGHLHRNTFEITWNTEDITEEIPEEEESDVSGYSYRLQLISSNPAAYSTEDFDWSRILPPENRIITVNGYKKYVNLDNGLWAFTVVPYDDVGNRGQAATVLLRLNKYIPVTLIYYLNSTVDQAGETTIKITGRGFRAEGNITEVYLDRDGRAPFDYTFSLKDNRFKIVNDRFIEGPSFNDVEKGTYKIGLRHQKRGITFSYHVMELEPAGTVKFGYFPPPEAPSYVKTQEPVVVITLNNLVIWLLLVLFSFFILASIKKLAGIVAESRMIEREVVDIFTGKYRAREMREEMMRQLRIKGVGLRLKFTLLISLLVILILFMVSIPLSAYMIETQRKDLTDGLKQQANVLLGSIASGAEKYLLLQDELELLLLPDSSTAMEDAINVTITGITERGTSRPTTKEFVWATNDDNIVDKIEGDEYALGSSVIIDEVSKALQGKAEEINLTANAEIGALAEKGKGLRKRLGELSLKSDVDSVQEFTQLSEELKKDSDTIKVSLKKLSDIMDSVPEFNVTNLDSQYTFFKPVVYQKPGEDIYYRGSVRLEVSTERIIETITKSSEELIIRIAWIAMIALGLGILGAFILASFTIRPIKQLVAGVATIRDTIDKSELKNHVINIKQKDEIRMLADTVNQMTQGLVKAAAANKDLTVGKEVQKMFIPLDKDSSGKKGTTGEEKNEFVEVFGYYEGAKGVSGDYFDFTKLDDQHYAVIKCDVAGKGVPAALIMVEVATIFLDHFKAWNPRKVKIDTEKLVYRMNDLIEERGFKGRFAALILGIINVKTGVCHFCNAGDNIVHMYSAAEGQMIHKKLPESPATGVFPNMLVEMQLGFKQVKLKLNKGDTLFLFTDGIEEAKRMFRDTSFNTIVCDEPGLEEGALHGETHAKGSGDEELGVPRIYDVINAVYNRQVYELKKYHNPISNEKLIFDFTRCEGTVKEAVLALVSVEKVFRLYKDPSATIENRITVDKKIDSFLQVYFEQYADYFDHPLELKDDLTYTGFTHLKEDEQYDDLTLISFMKL